MATVYLKQTGDTTLILNPREALIVPFDFGTGWKAISAGVFVSVVGLSGDNSMPPFNETLTNNTNPKNNFWLGLTTYSDPFPYNSSNTFWEYTNSYTDVTASNGTTYNGPFTLKFMAPGNSFGTTAQNSALNKIRVLDVLNSGFKVNTTGGKDVEYLSNTSDVSFRVGNTLSVTTTGLTGLSNYAVPMGVTFSLDRATKIYTGWIANPASYVQPSSTELNVNFLRQALTVITDTATNKSGYYTTANASTGNLLPLPNAFILYSPFYLNRLRIHNVVISQIS